MLPFISAGNLTLTFDEVVRDTTLLVGELTFFGSNSTVVLPSLTHVLGGGEIVDGPNDVVTLQLSTLDLNSLKSLSDVATSINDTYLSITQSFIDDMAGNDVEAVDKMQAGDYMFDIVDPELLSYTFNLSSGVLEMVFSEYVNNNTLDPKQISIQNVGDLATAGSKRRTLTGGFQLPSDSLQTVILQLTPADVDYLRSEPDIAEFMNNTFLSATKDLLLDGAENPFSPIPVSNARPVSNFTLDTVPPLLSSFTFDLNTGIVRLTFNEAVDFTTFQTSMLRLTSPSMSMYSTVGATHIATSDVTVIEVILSSDNLNDIKADTNLATSNTTTGILPMYNLVKDASGNSLMQSSDAVYTSNYTRDSESPRLLSFSLDLNERAIHLTFTETVDASNIDFAEIYLQSRVQGGSDRLSLNGSRTNSSNGPQITIDFSLDVTSNIKSNPSLATGTENTFLSFSARAFRDTAGNPVVAESQSNAIRASNHTPDSAPPELVSFSVDLNTDIIDLTFNEVVDLDSFDFRQFTFFSSSNTTTNINYTLSAGTVLTLSDSVDVRVMFDFDDINYLKRDANILVSSSSTVLVLGDGAVNDTNGNSITTTDRIEGSFISDVTGPRLSSFDVVMQGGTEPLELVLHFSEPVLVNALSTNLNLITLQTSTVANGSNDVTLTGGQVVGGNQVDVTVIIRDLDLDDIRDRPPLCQSNATCHLVISGPLVMDTSLQAMIVPGPLTPGVYNADLVRPKLDQFVLDMNTGLLNLTFDEVVNGSTLDPAGLVLQSSTNDTTYSEQLDNSTVITVGTQNLIVVQISDDELNTVKSLPELAHDSVSTYLSIDAAVGDLRDIANNLVEGIPSTDARPAQRFVPDTTPPVLNFFSVDLNSGSISFTFDETINISATVPGRITITNSTGTARYTLVGGSSVLSYDSEFVWELSLDDHNALKANAFIATDNTNTFLALNQGAFYDAAGNPVSAISGRPVMDYIKDEGRPELLSYEVDLTAEQLVFNFDETVNVSSLNISDVMLSDGMGQAYQLTTSSASHGPSSIVTVDISELDLNQLKADRICLTNITCLLTFTEDLIEDMVNASVLPRQNVYSERFVRDTIPPELDVFSEIDLILGTITLKFSETIDAMTFDPTGLVLMSFFRSEQHTTSFNLTGGSPPINDSNTVMITLDPSDFTAIRENPDLCDRRSHCYIVAGNNTVRDTSGHSLTPVPQSSPGRIAQRFIYDSVMPVLLHFDLDMNLGLLVLEFSEPINVDSVQLGEISLVARANASSNEQFALPNTAYTNSTNGDMVLYVYLPPTSLNSLKSLDVANRPNDTYISLTSAAVTDNSVSGNPIVAITMGIPQGVRNYTRDSTPPMVTSFVVDFDENTIIFGFDEPVQTMTVLSEGIVISNTSTVPAYNHTLSGGMPLESSTMSSSTTITIYLLRPDVEILKGISGLADNINQSFVGFSQGTFTDVAGNPIDGLYGYPAAVFTEDMTRVMLTNFTINLEFGTLSLTFDDLVNSGSFSAGGLALQNSRLASSSNVVPFTSLSTATSTADSFVVNVTIDPADLLTIKMATYTAKSITSTYLTIRASTIRDSNGFNVLAITNGNAIQAGAYTGDITGPSLTNFTLDLDSGSVILTFDDFIDTDTFATNQFYLQARPLMEPSFLFDADGISLSSDGYELTVNFTTSKYCHPSCNVELVLLCIRVNQRGCLG